MKVFNGYNFIYESKRFNNLVSFFSYRLYFAKASLFFNAETLGIVTFLKENLPKVAPNTASLLDIGSGRQPYAEIIKSKNYKYETADIVSSDAYKTTYIADAASLPVARNSYDVVVSFQTLEHLPDPDQSLQEWFRILKPVGILLVTTNFYYPQHGEPRDYYRFTQYGLQRSLVRNNFQSIRVSKRGNGLSIILITSFFRLRRVHNEYLILLSSLRFFPFKILFCFLLPFFLLLNTLFVSTYGVLALLTRDKVSNSRYIGVAAYSVKPKHQ